MPLNESMRIRKKSPGYSGAFLLWRFYPPRRTGAGLDDGRDAGRDEGTELRLYVLVLLYPLFRL